MVPIFVGKKDGKKKKVQDYQYLNEKTVKNNYILLLILEIIKNIGTKKVLTKLNLRQDYNIMRIKEENEQKIAFTILKGLFEPTTVMFFVLKNALAIFQVIMNEIIRDLINTGKIVKPLLTRKEQRWEWEIRQEMSFEILKKRFITELILVASDLNKKMRMQVDISTEGCQNNELSYFSFLFSFLFIFLFWAELGLQCHNHT